MSERRPAPAPAQGPDLSGLRSLVARLRAPDGCPWDREQEIGDLRAYLLEEAHELAHAIDGGEAAAVEGEMGDLLFMITFLAHLGEEEGGLSLAGAIEGVHRKMVQRHPHVFGDVEAADSAAVRRSWEKRKLDEEGERDSLLDGVSGSLPALLAAYRMTQKAAGVGFDWPAVAPVLDKIEEEIGELRQALEGAVDEKTTREAIREEVGDLLFSVVNLARKLEVDPEGALARTNLKFRRRFAYVETGLGDRLGEAGLEEMEELWQQAKSPSGRTPEES